MLKSIDSIKAGKNTAAGAYSLPPNIATSSGANREHTVVTMNVPQI